MKAADPDHSPHDDERIGSRIGKYKITAAIGRGGMGRVYEAVNTAIGKRVAIKLVDPEVVESRDAITRFQREAQAAGSVESAHIVQIFDSGQTEDGVPFIVMELLRGEDLGNRIKRLGRLELPDALHVTAQILRGLHRAHEAGIVHRDLKPDNVFLVDRDDDTDFAKILDFGISKIQSRDKLPVKTITRQGTVLGTPFYMSPEQAQAVADIDGRSDLWAVGAILYECLCGRPPHSGGTYEAVIVRICTKDADDIRSHNPAVPEPVAEVLKRALARERDERYESAQAFLEDLSTAAAGHASIKPLSGSRGGVTPRPRTVVRSPRIPDRSTPGRAAAITDELGPTMEAGSGPSRVGWSTSGGGASRRPATFYALVGISALAIGAGAVLLLREPTAVTSPIDAPAPVDLALEANAPHAVFTTGGAEIAGSRLKGLPGETVVVTAAAAGYETKEVLVTFDAAHPVVRVELERAPAPPPTAVASATPPAAPPSASSPPLVGPLTVRSAPPPSAPAVPPKIPPRPVPPPPTVAGGLELKTE